jgi:hypothetical protein
MVVYVEGVGNGTWSQSWVYNRRVVQQHGVVSMAIVFLRESEVESRECRRMRIRSVVVFLARTLGS